MTAAGKVYSPHHAKKGAERHVGGRWHSKFDATNLPGEGVLRQRLERFERSKDTLNADNWETRCKLVEKYTSRALPLLKGSGFVEAYHLMAAALELSEFPQQASHLTALCLNNIAVYHRRRGQGRNALSLLGRAERIEGQHPAISTQSNLLVLTTELGLLSAAAGHARCLLHRFEEEASLGLTQPAERSAVVAVALYNLGVALEATPSQPVVGMRGRVPSAHSIFLSARQVAVRDCGASHPVTSVLCSSIDVTSSQARDGGIGAHRPRLGRSVLGQRADGTTLAIGWPSFTLIDLQEAGKGKGAQASRHRGGRPLSGLIATMPSPSYLRAPQLHLNDAVVIPLPRALPPTPPLSENHVMVSQRPPPPPPPQPVPIAPAALPLASSGQATGPRSLAPTYRVRGVWRLVEVH